jgi:hypothetical protein
MEPGTGFAGAGFAEAGHRYRGREVVRPNTFQLPSLVEARALLAQL